MVGERLSLPPKICAQSDPPLLISADFDQYLLMTSQRTGSRLRAFQRAINEVRTLPLTPSKGGPKSKFVV